MATYKKNKVLSIVSLIGFVLFFIICMPGFISPDGIDQYEQSITGKYTDWHPIAMALLWSLLNKIYAGGELMLALQLLMYWVSFFLIAKNLPKKWVIVTAVLFFAAPFLINFSGYIIKDAQLALSWFLGSSIILQAIVSQRRLSTVESVVSGILLLYGLLVRIDAFAGFVPLLLLWVGVVFVQWSRMKKVALTFVALIFSFGVYQLLSSIPTEKTYPETKLILHDLSGIYVETGVNVYPKELFLQANGFDTAYVRQHYHTATFDMLWWNSDDVTIVPEMTPTLSKALRQAWWSAVKKHPIEYLKNRLDGYLYYLRLKTRGDNNMTYYIWVHPNEVGLVQNKNAFRSVYTDWLSKNKNVFYMQAWFWFFLNILLLFTTRRTMFGTMKHFCYALLLSSLLYRLIQLFIYQVDTDFRYFYWTCIACTITVIIQASFNRKKLKPR